MGQKKSQALPFFHAFTGSDTTSQFHGRGKKIAWESWKSYPEVTKAFLSVTTQPFSPVSITSEAVNVLERFTCILYDKSTPLTLVNELRQELKIEERSEITWKPIWTLLPEAAKASRELIKCGCKAIPQC